MLEEVNRKANQPEPQGDNASNHTLSSASSSVSVQTSHGHGWLNTIDNLQQIRHRTVFDKLQLDISGYIRDAKRECHEIGLALENSDNLLDQLESADGNPIRKQDVIGATAALRRTQRTLANRLQDLETYVARSYLNMNEMWGELERVRLLSLMDHFTGLPNRRAFIQKLEEEIARAQRYGVNLALALIDLDRFKLVNDRYGHVAGDKILQKFASEVLTEVRQQDIVARYGGEEFAILFPNTELSGAERALQHLGNLTADTKCKIDKAMEIALPTFSAGLTKFNLDDTVEDLVARADHALYQAKQLGRNRIIVDSLNN